MVKTPDRIVSGRSIFPPANRGAETAVQLEVIVACPFVVSACPRLGCSRHLAWSAGVRCSWSLWWVQSLVPSGMPLDWFSPLMLVRQGGVCYVFRRFMCGSNGPTMHFLQCVRCQPKVKSFRVAAGLRFSFVGGDNWFAIPRGSLRRVLQRLMCRSWSSRWENVGTEMGSAVINCPNQVPPYVEAILSSLDRRLIERNMRAVKP